jgi:DNA-binding response OmpR family regulator
MDTAAGRGVDGDAAHPRAAPADPPSDSAETISNCESLSAASDATTADSEGDPRLREALARAAHELKTPLAVIKGAATTLLASAEQWDVATQQELLQLIDAQVDRLHALVNGLLATWSVDVREPVSPSKPTPATAPRPQGYLPCRPRHPHERPVVLVADDDAHLMRYLRANLEAQGYRPLIAADAAQFVTLLDREDPDILLLDAALPDRAGSPTLARLREYSDAPTIVLGQGEESECVRALDLGAMDYLAKPFGIQELLARVRAALRHAAHVQTGFPDAIVHSGELSIDFAQHLVCMADRPIQLSRTEYKLLRVLAQHAGRVLSHELLLERVWGPGYGQEVEFLWVYVRRLRRRIEPDPRHPRYILTVPGVGYRLAQI